LMNGRYFAGRRISAAQYDGKERFDKVKGVEGESEEEEQRRLDAYAKWLESQGDE
ncbi:hypothetical protein HK102_014172, partial [Quaeritorhiza haematococci]